VNAIRVDVAFAPDHTDPATFDAFLEAVADEFYAIRDEELDYGGSLAHFRVTFVMTLPEPTIDAAASAMGDLRTAIHAAGGGTPGWPTRHSIVGSSMQDCMAS
jgi:hypothetical protein